MPSPSPSPKRSPKKQSPKQSPKRGVLHERSQSQANEIPLRLVRDDPSFTDAYSSTPFPTKPAHVLRPRSSYGQGFLFGEESGVSGATTPTPPLEHVSNRKDVTKLLDNAARPPTITDAQGLSLRDLYRSQAAAPGPPSTTALTEAKCDDEVQGSGTYSRRQSDEVIVLPHVPAPTIKRLESHSSLPAPPTSSAQTSSLNLVALGSPSSSNSQPNDGSSTSDVAPLDLSSPNIARIGRLSTPNLVSVRRSSSPNFVTLESSSPNYITTKTSDSSLTTSESQGTVKRHPVGDTSVKPLYSTFPSSASQSSPQPYSSSPPQLGLRTYASTSSFALPEPEHIYPSRPSSAARTSSIRSHTDLHSISESSSPIQYPIVRPPQSSSWAEIHIPKRAPKLMTDRSSTPSGRWNPHLSTVPSEWSAERQASHPSSMAIEEPSDTQLAHMLPRPPFVKGRDVTGSTVRMVGEADRDEESDSLTDLRSQELRTKTSGFLSILSSESRQNSLRSTIRRPSSSGSLFSGVPAWARAYYSRGNRDSLQSAGQLSSVADSRPTSSASPATDHFPLGIFRPRTRPREEQVRSEPRAPIRPRPGSLAILPADPRAHWAGGERTAMAEERHHPPWAQMATEWSPHLHPDSRLINARRSMWKAPSVDEKSEAFWSWRNAQVLAFILGFIFPPAWFIAAFLPLPPQPIPPSDVEALTRPSDPENYRERRTGAVHDILYENARWWRNLNRFMCAVGIVVVALVVGLQLVGCLFQSTNDG